MQITRSSLPLALALRHARSAAPLRGWDRIFRLLFSPDRQQRFQIELPFFDGVYVADIQHYIDWRVLFYGAYDKADVTVMRRILARLDRPTVLDVGANIGHHTLAVAKLAGAVHAFEPFSGVWPVFEKKVARYGATNVTLHKIALGSSNACRPFLAPSTNNTGTGTFSGEGDQMLEVRRGDDFLREQSVAHVDLIKIDVEGYEPDVLGGLADTLGSNRPVVVVEVNETTAAIRAVLPSGYRFFANVRKGAIFDTTHLVEVTDRHRRGDVFCVPAEKIGLIADGRGEII